MVRVFAGSFELIDSESISNQQIIFIFLQIDYDVCSNYGNWNYSAGIGNDPREDRKFNMIKQGLDYDPEVRIDGDLIMTMMTFC